MRRNHLCKESPGLSFLPRDHTCHLLTVEIQLSHSSQNCHKTLPAFYVAGGSFVPPPLCLWMASQYFICPQHESVGSCYVTTLSSLCEYRCLPALRRAASCFYQWGITDTTTKLDGLRKRCPGWVKVTWPPIEGRRYFLASGELPQQCNLTY